MRSSPTVARSVILCLVISSPRGLIGQEPAAWSDPLVFQTFSIAAVDPATGESGVAVTTRVPCVGNGVPWVRAGVGAVATQAFTRTAYGVELLDLLEQGLTPAEALERAVAADTLANRRQLGVVSMDGASAQHTGEDTNPWAGHRSGPNFAVQGNLLVGPEVVEAVAREFAESEGSPGHLADRLISALAAGQAVGGDARKGRPQSAAVVVADPREGRSRRADGLTANINVCEHPTPVAELRRIYGTISQTLGYREIHGFVGNDVWQLKVMLHALGFLGPSDQALERTGDWNVFTAETADAVDRFRADQGLSTRRRGSPPGYVDRQLVALLWDELERASRADELRRRFLEMTQVRR